MDIIDKMYQLQALRKLTDDMTKEIHQYMDNNIEVDEYGYNDGFSFDSITQDTVKFTGWNRYCGSSEDANFELPIEEFKEIISGKKELKYKSTI